MAVGVFTFNENGESFQLSTDDVIIVQTLDSLAVITATRGTGASLRNYTVTETAAVVANILELTQLSVNGTTAYVDPEKIISSGDDFVDLDYDGNVRRLFSTTITATKGTYKSYVALLTQSGTSAPTDTVLYNSFGVTVEWGYSDVGEYITTNEIFTQGKTWVVTGGSDYAVIKASVSGSHKVTINTADSATQGAANGVLSSTAIEIRVYE